MTSKLAIGPSSFRYFGFLKIITHYQYPFNTAVLDSKFLILFIIPEFSRRNGSSAFENTREIIRVFKANTAAYILYRLICT
jgi:hypothetical protein